MEPALELLLSTGCVTHLYSRNSAQHIIIVFYSLSIFTFEKTDMLMSVKEKFFRNIAFLFSFIVLILQFMLIQSSTKNFTDFITQTITFFSYMTILSNTLAAIAYIVPLLFKNGRAKFFSTPSFQSAILVYISIIFIVYHLLLAKT